MEGRASRDEAANRGHTTDVSPRQILTRTTQWWSTLRGRVITGSATLVLVLAGLVFLRSDVTEVPVPTTFFDRERPATRMVESGRSAELGLRLTAQTTGQVTAIRFFKGGRANGGRHVGSVWSSTGIRLRRVVFTNEGASGWQRADLATPLPITAGQEFVVSYYAPRGHFSRTQHFFEAPMTVGELTAFRNAGVIRVGRGGGFPTRSVRASAYFVDVVFIVPSALPPPGDTTTGGDWPGPDSTGVPPGTRLTASGPLLVTKPYAVIEDLLIRGGVIVRAPGVVIRRCRIVGGVIDNGDDPSSNYGTLIEDVEIDGTGLLDAARRPGIGYSGFRVVRVDIHHVGVGVNANGNNIVKDSWIHDLVVEGDPGSGGTHNEPILSNGGTNMTFVGNRLDAGTQPNMTGALVLLGDFAQIRDVLVQSNLLEGGGYSLYAGSELSKPYPYAADTRILQNVMSTRYSQVGGTWGPATAFRSGNGNEWSGNLLGSRTLLLGG